MIAFAIVYLYGAFLFCLNRYLKAVKLSKDIKYLDMEVKRLRAANEFKEQTLKILNENRN